MKVVMNSLSTTRRILSAITIAIVASSTVLLAADDPPFERITAKAVYITREGVAPDARPAFEIQAQSFASMMRDERSQLLMHELSLSNPREPVMRPLRFGERAIEIRVAEPERVSLLKRISPSYAAMAAGMVTALLVSQGVLVAGIGTVAIGAAIVLTDAAGPLEEIVNREGAERALVPTLVNEGGIVTRSAGHVTQRLPDGQVKDFASYVVRHLRRVNSPPILEAWLMATASQFAFGHFFPPGNTLAKVVKHEIEGTFVGVGVDLFVRAATPTTDGGCYTLPVIPNMMSTMPTSMPILCNQSLTPTLQVAAPAPMIATTTQAVPLQIRSLVPEVNAWFDHRATAVQVFPTARGTFMVVPNYESTSVPLHTTSPGSSSPSGGGDRRAGGESSSSPSAGPRDQSLRGLPIGVHLKGDFGSAISIDRHQ